MTVATKVRLLSPLKKPTGAPSLRALCARVGSHGRHSATDSSEYLFWRLRRKEKVGSLSVLCTHFSAYSAFKILTFGSLCVLREISSLRCLRLRF
jgi:hypothetical protein